MHNKAGAGMSDCKHKKRSSYMRLDGSHVSCCQDCDADFAERELATLERAEKAEARVKELEDSIKADTMLERARSQGDTDLARRAYQVLSDEYMMGYTGEKQKLFDDMLLRFMR